MFTTLGSLFGSMVISILVNLCARDPLEWWTQSDVRALWTKCLHAASNAYRTLWISAPCWSFLATRSILTTRTVYIHALVDLHPSGTH